MSNRNRNYGKGKRNTKRGNKGAGAPKDTGVQTSAQGKRLEDNKTNDIIWWAKSPLYPLATNLQYNKIPGYMYDHTDFTVCGNTLNGNVANVASEPGIVAIEYIPSVGYANGPLAPANLCFNSLMAELVAHTNSGNVGFQFADLAMLTLATSSIITQVGEIERACGITNLYYRENANFPGLLLEALRMNLSDVAESKASIIMQLQTLVQNFNALKIPSYIDLFKRAMQMSRNIYMDEDSIMGQIYAFISRGYYIYDDRQMGLVWHEYQDYSLEEKLKGLSDSLEALRNTSDLPNVMGALRRAFPDVAVIELAIPLTTDVVVPAWDRNVTWQINNIECLGAMPVAESLNVTQDSVGNRITFAPYMDTEVVMWDADRMQRRKHILSSFNGEIGNEFVMEATRFKFNIENDGKFIRVTDFGTELIVGMTVHFMTEGEDIITYNTIPIPQYMNMDNAAIAGKALSYISRFRNHPYIELFSLSEHTSYGIVGDRYVWTEVESIELKQIQLAALQSIYLITTTGARQI